MDSSNSIETSYTIPFIMPCFYYTGMDKDSKIFIDFYDFIYKKYDDLTKKVSDDGSIIKKYERKYSSLWDNYSYFGFIIILYYCLNKSDNLRNDDNIKDFYKKNFEVVRTDIAGFNIVNLKNEIDNLLFKEEHKNSIVFSKRQYNNYDMFKTNNVKEESKNIVWYYKIYLDYIREIKLNYSDVNNNALKIKKIFFVSSSIFFSKIDLNKFFDIPNKKDIEYFDVINCEVNGFNHSGCQCTGIDCIDMINFFSNYQNVSN
ncbi:hypothetical protein [Brachyspira innocens]|uniref:hypothetical protein n=1 Tax=Brachyspira innocens TaxID=13264 RepID=UPI0026F1231A|nr:hypothetical protein [Brachyspira innocens]